MDSEIKKRIFYFLILDPFSVSCMVLSPTVIVTCDYIVAIILWASLIVQMVKNLPEMQETWVRKIHWRINGYPLQYFCLENSMDKSAWWATVHGAAKSRTQLSD